MTQIATRKPDIERLQRLVRNKERIDKLRAQIKELEAQTEADEQFLRKRHANGIALELPRGRAKILQFTTFDRECVDIDKVKKLLKNKLPMRTTSVTRVSLIDGVVE